MYRKGKKNKNRFVIIFVIVICFVLSCFFIKKNYNFPNLFLKDGILFTDNFLGKFFNDKDYNDLVLENEKLRHELDMYKSYKSVNDELSNEISKLKEVVKINDLFSDSFYINGKVINRSFDYWQEKLFINVGKNDGIVSNMAVISGGSLIGIIDDVSSSNSSVLLLCNKKFPMNISVKVQIGDSYAYGILDSYDSNSKMFSVVGVVENISIPDGAMVVTTGLGSIFPSGVLVGYVDSITTDNFDLAKVINVKPSANFDDISYVTVLKRDDK